MLGLRVWSLRFMVECNYSNRGVHIVRIYGLVECNYTNKGV